MPAEPTEPTVPGEAGALSHEALGLDAGTRAALWPDAGDGPTRSVEYLAVPNLAQVRSLLPVDRRLATSVLRSFRVRATRSARLRDYALRGLVRATGGRPLLRDRVRLLVGEGSVEERLSRQHGARVHLGVQLGPPRANRKPVLQAVDPSGRPVLVGKLATNALTQRLVNDEAAALRQLAAADLSGIRIPRLIALDDNGSPLLVTDVLPLADGRPASPGQVRAAMVVLARSLPAPDTAPADLPVMQGLLERTARLNDDRVRDAAQQVLDRLRSLDTRWPTGRWHGDWTMWNMTGLGPATAEILLWDFERLRDGVPLGWDALHLRLQTRLGREAPEPVLALDLVRGSASLLAPFGVDESSAPHVALAYLVEIAVRYAEDDQRRAGSAAGDVARWLVPALTELAL